MMPADHLEPGLHERADRTGGPHRRGDGPRSIHLRLARLHLRTGAFGLARAELETAAGSGDLDDEALLDLAEIRWRTGDLGGAGDAADAYLAAGGGEALGYVIASEATAALGRPGEARRLARRALERAEQPLDSLFAGISRSGVWPHDPAAPAEPVGTLFAPGAGATVSRAWTPPAQPSSEQSSPGPGLESASPISPPGDGFFGAHEPGLWDEHPEVHQPAVAALPEAASEVAVARAALGAGQDAAAALHLALALRVDPSLAPAVLELAADRPGLAFDLLRGDAHRLSGDETEARRAYAAAAAALPAAEPDDPAAPAAALDHPSLKEES